MTEKSSRGNSIIPRVIRVILIVLGALIILGSLFTIFRIRVQANQSLRDAKNVYMALNAAQIEFYSKGESIFDPSNYRGISKGVDEIVNTLADSDGEYRIISYDSKNHIIKEMIYQNNNYYITFRFDNGSNDWTVRYLMPVYLIGE